MIRFIPFVGLFLLLSAPSQAAIFTQSVSYAHGGTQLEGFLTYDDSFAGKRPGVMVVHEWWGLNDYAKTRAKQLAKLGYVAFAADIFGKGVLAKSPEEAGALAATFYKNRELFRDRVSAGLKILEAQPQVDKTKIAAIGYCFGGTAVLELARSGADMKGVVSFHGGLSTPEPAKPGVIKTKILVLHGALDPHVSADDVAAFQEEMRKVGADYQFVAYSGAVHAFTNPASGNLPSRGVAYNEAADRRSWAAMKLFFEELFG